MELRNSPLIVTMGDTPMTRILSFLIAHKDLDYSKTDLANYTELSRQSIYKGIDPLLKYGIIHSNRKIGNTELYQINFDSPPVKSILSYVNRIVSISIEKQKTRQ